MNKHILHCMENFMNDWLKEKIYILIGRLTYKFDTTYLLSKLGVAFKTIILMNFENFSCCKIADFLKAFYIPIMHLYHIKVL